MADEYMLYPEPVKLKFINNDIACGFDSCDLKAFIDPDFSNICLEGKEIKWIIKSFFQLMYGEDVVLQNENLLDLKPFTAKSSAIIDQAKEDVIHWKLGDSYSNDYDFCSCFMAGSHMNPDETYRAFREIGARHMLLAHWGTFRLGNEPVHFPPRDMAEVMAANGAAEQLLPLGHGETLVYG